MSDAGKGQCRQTGFLGWLEHSGVAHREGGADRPSDDLHRVVPWHDVTGDAMGFAQGVDGVAVEIGNGLAMHLVGRTAIELHVAGERDGVVTRLSQRLADIGGLKFGQYVDLVEHPLADTGENAATLDRGHASPHALKRGMRGIGGRVDVAGAAAGDFTHRFSRRRVLQVETVAAFGRHPFAVDETVCRVEAQSFCSIHGCASHCAVLDRASRARSASSRIGVAASSSRV